MMPDFVTKNEKRKAESRQSARAAAAAGPPAAAGRFAGPPANRTLFHHDNLDVLRGINSATIDLIATDPPFNKSRDFHATPDSLAKGAKFEDRWFWDRDVHPEWVDAIKDDWPAVWAVIESTRVAAGEDMAAFLCWLGVRLMECHRVLKDTGSLYLQIDFTAHAYAKCLLDGIFGRRNFQNEIVWCYSSGGSSPSRYARKHDTLLFYSKSTNFTFNTPRMPHTSVISAANAHLFNPEGKVMPDWWTDIQYLHHSVKERTGYPTQKPLALYERIINASSNEDGVVLDPFCGCATTPVAAEKLGRHWIGIDIWDKAHATVLKRLSDSQLAVPGVERDDPYLWTEGDVIYTTTPPERTDYDETPAVPDLRLRAQRAPEPWERLSREDMTRILAAAQAHANGEGVICAGCGRILEVEFMELDHITPKSGRGANNILNRILLCRPCNGRKGNHLTLPGLLRENKRPTVRWMRNEALARLAWDNAEKRANWVRDNFGSEEYRAFMAGL